jgi:hypothetical protein
MWWLPQLRLYFCHELLLNSIPQFSFFFEPFMFLWNHNTTKLVLWIMLFSFWQVLEVGSAPCVEKWEVTKAGHKIPNWCSVVELYWSCEESGDLKNATTYTLAHLDPQIYKLASKHSVHYALGNTPLRCILPCFGSLGQGPLTKPFGHIGNTPRVHSASFWVTSARSIGQALWTKGEAECALEGAVPRSIGRKDLDTIVS